MNVSNGQRKYFFEMKEGHILSYVKMLIFGKLLGVRYFLEILHTWSTVKTSKNVVKSECF